MDRRKIELPVGSLLGHEVANRGKTLKNAVAVLLPNLEAPNPTELKALIVSQHELIVSRDSGNVSHVLQAQARVAQEAANGMAGKRGLCFCRSPSRSSAMAP
jgi:hypothetical protein